MIVTLARWEIRTEPSKYLGSDIIHTCPAEAAQPETPPSALDEQEAADFVTRQVLEKDAKFFDG
jgi:hypothetical protein